jgi:hypothetical protein
LEDILSSSGPSKESSTNNTRMIILTSWQLAENQRKKANQLNLDDLEDELNNI